MRQFTEHQEKQLEAVYCNMCRKKLLVQNGLLIEGALSVDKVWGYFSKKDGERHSFDLCEECYNKLVQSFSIPVDITDQNELL